MKRRTEKAITLIALIITIVILLILAIVSIGAINQSGIIAHAQNAAGDYNDEKGKEEGTLLGYEALIDKYAPGVTLTDDNVPVPAGFKVVEGTKDTGLVIEHETEGSQFVWVPVTKTLDPKGYGQGTTGYREPDVITDIDAWYDNNADNLTNAGCIERPDDDDKDLNADDFIEQLTREYQEMVESVNKNKGFYIGRYEVSPNGNKAQSRGSTDTESVYSAINNPPGIGDGSWGWYDLYDLCKSYNTRTIKSSMIWGCQYDALADWMGEEATNFDTEKRNTDPEIRTGFVDTDIIKNVYDLAGCACEYTMELYGDYGGDRVLRGGAHSFASTPTSYTIRPGYVYGYSGSRMALFIRATDEYEKYGDEVWGNEDVGFISKLGKYAKYDTNGNGSIEDETILWKVLRDDLDKVELITADALGEIEFKPSSFEEARTTYNNIINILVAKCEELTGITNGKIRNIGGPRIDETTETIKFTDGSIEYLNPDESIYESDNDQMAKANVWDLDNGLGWWYSTRIIYSGTEVVSFAIYKDGEGTGPHTLTHLFGEINNQGVGTYTETSETLGVRPILELEAGTLDNVTKEYGTIDNPIAIYQSN